MFSPEILFYGRLLCTFVNVGRPLLFSGGCKEVSEAKSNIPPRPERRPRRVHGFVLVALFTQMQLCVSKRDRRDVNMSELKAPLQTRGNIAEQRSKVQLSPPPREEVWPRL